MKLSTAHPSPVLGVLMALMALAGTLHAESSSTTVHMAKPMPADEAPGARPYEMVRAGRQPPHAPLVDFDLLEGWQVECSNGAAAELFGSQRQRVWESPVARLVYRGTSNASTVVLRPPAPMAIPDDVSATTIWVHGNNWSWAPEPGTPRTTVTLVVLDRDNAELTLDLAQVAWKEWWLIHSCCRPARQEAAARGCGSPAAPTRTTGNSSGAVFFKEGRLRFLRAASEVASTRSGSRRALAWCWPVPFPTREQTILPDNRRRTSR